MILDTSALMAILFVEPEARRFVEAIGAAEEGVTLSAATLVEASLVAEGRGGREMGDDLDALLRRMRARVVPLTGEQALTARDGWRRYGKGRHPAGLNLGDCFAYALAQERGEALLFKGADFALTDVRKAL